MNKKQILTIIQTFTAVIILLTVGVILTIIWKNTKKDTNNDNVIDMAFGDLSLPIEKNIELDLEVNINTSQRIKTTNKVYKVDREDKSYPSRTLSDKLAITLKADLISSQNNVYTYLNKNTSTSIIYDDNLKIITIYYNNLLPTEKKKFTEIEKGTNLSKAKLEELGLWPYKNDYSIAFKYFKVDDNNYYEIKSPNNASFASIYFRNKINEFPIITSSIDTGEIEVFVDSSNNISKITYSYRPMTKSTGTYPIRTVSDASKSITYKNAELIIPFEGKESRVININKLNIGYRIEFADQEYLQPVYIYEGSDNYDQIISVLVPVIESTYLTR